MFSMIPQNFTMCTFPNSGKLYGIIILLHKGGINAWFHTKAMLHEAVSVAWFRSVTFFEKQEKISIVWLSHKQEVIRWDFSLIFKYSFWTNHDARIFPSQLWNFSVKNFLFVTPKLKGVYQAWSLRVKTLSGFYVFGTLHFITSQLPYIL